VTAGHAAAHVLNREQTDVRVPLKHVGVAERTARTQRCNRAGCTLLTVASPSTLPKFDLQMPTALTLEAHQLRCTCAPSQLGLLPRTLAHIQRWLETLLGRPSLLPVCQPFSRPPRYRCSSCVRHWPTGASWRPPSFGNFVVLALVAWAMLPWLPDDPGTAALGRAAGALGPCTDCSPYFAHLGRRQSQPGPLHFTPINLLLQLLLLPLYPG